jgi:hypothetical protein
MHLVGGFFVVVIAFDPVPWIKSTSVGAMNVRGATPSCRLATRGIACTAMLGDRQQATPCIRTASYQDP